MHFRLPKPLHGWREFAGEVGIIVVGVMIALGAEQVVEDFHQRGQLREIEGRMTAELRDDDLPQAFARGAIGACNADQLDQIERAIADGDRARLADLATRYKPPFRSWDDQAWKAALASPAFTGGGSARMIDWSTPYNGIPILTQLTTDEQARLPELRVRMSGAGPLSAEQQDRMFQVLAKLKVDNAHMTGASRATLQFAASAGVTVPPQARARILAEARRIYGACVSDPLAVHRDTSRPYDAPPVPHESR